MSSPLETDVLLTRRQAAIRYLYGRINYERLPSIPYHDRTFKLDRMHELLDRLGNPDRTMKIVHVAGTKGKGSTSVMIGSILRAAGRRVGLFTSPHLERIEERMVVDGIECPAEEFVDLLDTLVPIIEAMDREREPIDGQPDGPTYFEITTAMALLHFLRCRADTAVLEVGLGGRLDSTNVCRPEVSVITSISFDHMQQLGGTLELIAREKAGIVKPGVPLVSGATAREPREAIREVCLAQGSRIMELGIDFDVEYRAPRELDRDDAPGEIDFVDRSDSEVCRRDAVSLGLVGRHQACNAAVALATIGELRRQGWQISDEAVRAGLAAARCPVRVEVVSRRPAVIVDAAHNAASIEALVATLEESFAPRRTILVFGTTQEKDVRGMLETLLPRFDEVLLTRYQHNPRAIPPQELAELAGRLTGRACRVCSRPDEAWQVARGLAADDDLICITGSFYLATEMRQLAIRSIEERHEA
ncbi:MAG: bifunctional folylpolyglutamate synthase/dihydrofolate synthase [Planctomycetaceae bacterium]|nr:bifunctional folylpolyglutamate synthase/dihydrofolate synthase [Planctomycetaceae bacterium]